MKFSALRSFLFLILLSAFYFLFSANLASAASQTTPAQTNNYPTATTNSEVPNNVHNSTQNTVIEIMSALTCQLSGIDPINPKQPCLGVDQKSGKIGFLPSPQTGAIGFMGNMISALYTSPIHTSDYFQNLASNFGITKKTYAQQAGTGFEGLKPLLGLWTTFRNIAYLVFVIIFVAIGLAIMLRIKIDPRTVMSIQNQIPKIIIGILLVTFSYAIAGFLIDMMYGSIYVVGNIITSANSKMNPSIVTDVASSTNPFAAANRSVRLGAAFKSSTAVGGELKDILETPGGRILTTIIGGVAGNYIINALPKNQVGGVAGKISTGNQLLGKAVGQVGNLGTIIGGALGTFIAPGAGTAGGAVIGASIGNTVGNFIGNFAVTGAVGAIVGPFVVSGIATLVVFLILTIAMLTALFRLWFALLMAYIHILLDVVLAPFWIIGGIVPGSPINVSGWLKDIIANLIVFPIVIAMFLLGKVFQDAIGNGNTANFVPPLIGDRISPDAIKGFISFGIVLITPNVLNVIKTALKVPKMDTGLGKALGVGAAIPGKAIGNTLGTAAAYKFDPFDQKKTEGEKGVARVIQRIFR